jgi:hypothetical protein
MVKKTIFNHNAPLLPTRRQLGQLNSCHFARFFLASFNRIRSTQEERVPLADAPAQLPQKPGRQMEPGFREGRPFNTV